MFQDVSARLRNAWSFGHSSPTSRSSGLVIKPSARPSAGDTPAEPHSTGFSPPRFRSTLALVISVWE